MPWRFPGPMQVILILWWLTRWRCSCLKFYSLTSSAAVVSGLNSCREDGVSWCVWMWDGCLSVPEQVFSANFFPCRNRYNNFSYPTERLTAKTEERKEKRKRKNRQVETHVVYASIANCRTKTCARYFSRCVSFFYIFILRVISEPLTLCGTLVGKHCSKQILW